MGDTVLLRASKSYGGGFKRSSALSRCTVIEQLYCIRSAELVLGEWIHGYWEDQAAVVDAA